MACNLKGCVCGDCSSRKCTIFGCHPSLIRFVYRPHILFISGLFSICPKLQTVAYGKVPRLAVRILAYNYVCFHISDKNDIWENLLGRSNVPARVRLLFHVISLSFASAGTFHWPSFENISKLRECNSPKRPLIVLENPLVRIIDVRNINSKNKFTVLKIRNWTDLDTKIASIILLRLCVIAQNSAVVTLGIKATIETLAPTFSCNSFEPNRELF